MRCLLSLVLLAAFGFPLIAPALALGQDHEAALPACCRRNGAHRCSMKMHRQPTSEPTFSERCPNFPQPSNSPSLLSSTALLLTANPVAFEFLAPTAPQQAEAQRRISRARSHQKRGPPSVLLA
jgi:hypothetical protein